MLRTVYMCVSVGWGAPRRLLTAAPQTSPLARLVAGQNASSVEVPTQRRGLLWFDPPPGQEWVQLVTFQLPLQPVDSPPRGP